MALPFTEAQCFGVFRAHNTAVWPAQPGLLGLAAAAVAGVDAQPRWAGVVISAILAGLWAWLALAWCLVGVQAAALVGLHADLGLAVAAVLGAVLLGGARAPSPR